MHSRFSLPSLCVTWFAWSACVVLSPFLDAQSFPPSQVPETERAKIDAALPLQAPIHPQKPRRLLIFDRNVGYGGHPSIAHASYAFQAMGRKTGAFETEIAQDPEVFRKESLQRFDAVFFNNNVGNLFEDPELRRNLVEFIYAGGGMLGVHGTTVAFTKWPGAMEDWPEFGRMLGARGANHRDSNERVIVKVEDPAHPITQAFEPNGFEYRDELFRYQEVYSRKRNRVLLSIDVEKTGTPQGDPRGACVRADGDYALAWIRQYGRGRAFHSTFAHNPYVFWDPKMLQFYLAALQFTLGDLPCATLPSALWNPAAQAQEKLGWRVGLSSHTEASDLFSGIQAASQQGLWYWKANAETPISPKIQKTVLDPLTAMEFQELRFQLDDAGVRMVAWEVPGLPSEESAGQVLFQKARSMGVEVVIAPVQWGQMPKAALWCERYGVRLAITQVQVDGKNQRQPAELARLCASLPPGVGVAASLKAWKSARTTPKRAVRSLGQRLMVLTLDEPASTLAEKSGITWEALREIRAQKLHPFLFHTRSLQGQASLEVRTALLDQQSIELSH